MSENQNKVNETQVKKVQELLGSQEFVKELTNTATIEEAQELFKSRGVETTEDELKMLGNLINKIREKNGELSQDELDSVVGGGVGSVAKKVVGGTVGAIGGAIAGAVGGAFLTGVTATVGDAIFTGVTNLPSGVELGTREGIIAHKKHATGGTVMGALAGAILGAKRGVKWGERKEELSESSK